MINYYQFGCKALTFHLLWLVCLAFKTSDVMVTGRSRSSCQIVGVSSHAQSESLESLIITMWIQETHTQKLNKSHGVHSGLKKRTYYLVYILVSMEH